MPYSLKPTNSFSFLNNNKPFTMPYRILQGLNNPQLSDLVFSPTDSLPFTHTSLLPIPWACQIFVSNDCYLGMLSSLISLIWLVIVITEISACVSSRGECSSMHTLLWTLLVSAVSFIILAYFIDFILPIIIWSHCFWFSCFKIIIDNILSDSSTRS